MATLTRSLTRPMDRWALGRIFKLIGPAPIRLIFKNDEGISPPGVDPVATVMIPNLGTLLALMWDPEVAFGEAYTDGRIHVEGDLVKFLQVAYESASNAPAYASLYSRLASKWMDFRQSNSPRASRHNIHRHYDLGNEFYKLWLDRQLVYTCAYFHTPEASLEEAQVAKMDHICRKLRLQAGETVVEAGCGWGAFALHMAREYGVSVKAYNISHEQILFARDRARSEGLSGRVEFIEDDYRGISGKFDVFVSVGMLEHIGVDHYRALGEIIHRSLGDSGRGLLHFIGRNYPTSLSRWIRKRIFPGACPPTLGQTTAIFEPWNFSILDVENLRLHYAKTLEHWLDRFDKAEPKISAMYDDRFVRSWRLYLAGSLAAFQAGTMQLFQVLFAGSKCEPMFWTRAPLYADATPAQAAPSLEAAEWTPATS
jgi:cyclopropane-fatty-acyl-phospholipid synthase